MMTERQRIDLSPSERKMLWFIENYRPSIEELAARRKARRDAEYRDAWDCVASDNACTKADPCEACDEAHQQMLDELADRDRESRERWM